MENIFCSDTVLVFSFTLGAKALFQEPLILILTALPLHTFLHQNQYWYPQGQLMLDVRMSSDITSSVTAFSHNSLYPDVLDIASCKEERSRGGAGKVNISGWGVETRQTRSHITLQNHTRIFRRTVSLFSWWNTLCLPVPTHDQKLFWESSIKQSLTPPACLDSLYNTITVFRPQAKREATTILHFARSRKP